MCNIVRQIEITLKQEYKYLDDFTKRLNMDEISDGDREMITLLKEYCVDNIYRLEAKLNKLIDEDIHYKK